MATLEQAVGEQVALNYAKTASVAPSCRTTVRRNRKGRGVYAARSFRKGEVVERAPVLVVPSREINGVLEHYVYRWSRGRNAVAFGVGSLFNHAIYPNLRFTFDRRSQQIVYRARQPIKRGEELTIHYYSEPGTNPDLGFTVKE